MLSNLKAALSARKIHQVNLAIELRIPSSTLSEIVNGRRDADPALRARIARELNADEAWLFSNHTHIPAPRNIESEAQPAPALSCSAATAKG